MGPEFSQVVEGVWELTAQNPFPPILITVLYFPFEKLLHNHPRVLVFQHHERIPSLDKSGACDLGLTSHNIISPNCVIALEMGMWPQSS